MFFSLWNILDIAEIHCLDLDYLLAFYLRLGNN